MSSRTPWLSLGFPVLLCAPVAAQRLTPVDRQLVAAGMWAEARYNYAYWDAVPPEVPARTEANRWEGAVAEMLEGERGTALHLQLKLPGGEQRGASVTRSVAINARWPIEVPALEADTLPDGAIWLRINSLADPGVLALFDRALGDAPREGPRHRGLILIFPETT